MKLWSLKPPTDKQIRAFFRSQAEQPVTYFGPASLDERPPKGFYFDDNRVLLGSGEQTFKRACDCLRRWEMYPKGWLRLIPPQPMMQAGSIVIVVGKAHGLYWKNACRIVTTYDKQHPAPQKATGRDAESFGFVYVTLPAHIECGQERFLVVRDARDQVWFEIRAFSKPYYWLAKLAAPLVRRVQQRFFTEAMARMVAALKGAQQETPTSSESIAPERTPTVSPRERIKNGAS